MIKIRGLTCNTLKKTTMRFQGKPYESKTSYKKTVPELHFTNHVMKGYETMVASIGHVLSSNDGPARSPHVFGLFDAFQMQVHPENRKH